MIIDDNESNPNEDDATRTVAKKKGKDQGKGKKTKKQKVDSQNEERGDDDALIFDVELLSFILSSIRLATSSLT